MKGISPIIIALLVPLTTALVWCSIIFHGYRYRRFVAQDHHSQGVADQNHGYAGLFNYLAVV